MKNLKSILLGTLIGLSCLNAYSQGPALPAPSPAASVSQVFGLTKIEINYSSPAVRNRQIWGSLVPYDSVWRTGANKATDISFSTDVMIGGKAIKKGKYALFTIPGRNSWTVILNSDPEQFGAFEYKKSMDVVRLMVTPQAADMKERMTFMIDAVNDSMGVVTLWWEKLKVSFNVIANTKQEVVNSIVEFSNNSNNIWRYYASSANYYVDNNLDLKQAHDWAEMSIGMKSHFLNHYVMAKVLHAQGDNKEALKYAKEAKELGEQDSNKDFYNGYRDRIEKLIADLDGATPVKKK